MQGLAYSQQVQDFSLPEVNTGEVFSLATLGNQKAIVLIYMSNNCPFATAYLERLNRLADDFPEVTFAMINAFSTPNESMVNMKTTWMEWETGIPYLADKEQTTTNLFKVRKSPTVVVLKPLNDVFSVYYIGQIDNNPQVAGDVKEAYLLENLQSLMEDKPPIHPNNQPIGCTIR
jgi:peroxiredoxin